MLRADSLAWTPPGATRPVFADVTLELRRGELVALVGASGSGKSTLLRCLAGLCDATAGAVMVDGHGAPSPGVVAIAFQNPDHQFVAARVDRELAFGLEVRQVARAEQHETVRRTARALGMAERLDAPPSAFSSGERQRIGLAASMVTSPDFLLADEPTSHLDLAARAGVLRQLRRLAEAGAGVLFVTPFPEEAVSADRVWVLDGGTLRDLGPGVAAAGQPGVQTDLSRLARVAGLPPTAGAREVAHTWQPRSEGHDCSSEPSAPLLVSARDLLLRHAGAEWVLTVERLDIAVGERLVLLGASGSGKSSVLHALAGALRPAAGSVIWRDGARVAVGYLLQAPERLFHRTSAWDELGPLSSAEVPHAEALLRTVGLDPGAVRARSAFHFSVGEQRRLALAGQLLRRPDLLLLDEPTAGLDGEAAEAVCEVIRNAVTPACAVVVATHDLGRTAALATRVALVRNGALQPRLALSAAVSELVSQSDGARDVGDERETALPAELLPAWWRIRRHIARREVPANILPCNELDIVRNLASPTGPAGGLC